MRQFKTILARATIASAIASKVTFTGLSIFISFSSFGKLPSHLELRQLDGNLKGIKIIRLEPWLEPSDSESINANLSEAHSLYMDVFSKAYTSFSEELRSRDPKEFSEQLGEDFEEDVNVLLSPRSKDHFFFLEAIETETNKVLGLATFERKAPGMYYLSLFAATYFKNPFIRGIGKQLLCTLNKLDPEAKSIELLAIDEPGNPAVGMYEHWGFRRGPVNEKAHLTAPYTGMILEKDALTRFYEKCL